VTPGLRTLALAAGFAMAVGGCRDVGGAGSGHAAPAPAASPVAPPLPPSDRATMLPADAVSVAPPAEFDRYPALAAAVEAAAAAAREAFEADARAAAGRGEDVGAWSLRIDWRVLRGNRYLWLVEGDGEAVRGAAPAPVRLRLAYDGIGKQVLDFQDWFRADAWPQVIARLREQLPAGTATPAADDWRTLPYEPVFRPDGQVMRFDLLLPQAPAAAPLRMPVPRELVSPWLADDRQVLLDATAAGP
jgi:hypothetical protein